MNLEQVAWQLLERAATSKKYTGEFKADGTVAVLAFFDFDYHIGWIVQWWDGSEWVYVAIAAFHGGHVEHDQLIHWDHYVRRLNATWSNKADPILEGYTQIREMCNLYADIHYRKDTL